MSSFINSICEASAKLSNAPVRMAPEGHYYWHIEWRPHQVHRKLSASIQLTDSGRYEGYELQFHSAREIETAPRERGAVIVFPSFIQHRMTP
jgi:PKHD-type hydroxylase